jgi:hypothetical protein
VLNQALAPKKVGAPYNTEEFQALAHTAAVMYNNALVRGAQPHLIPERVVRLREIETEAAQLVMVVVVLAIVGEQRHERIPPEVVVAAHGQPAVSVRHSKKAPTENMYIQHEC